MKRLSHLPCCVAKTKETGTPVTQYSSCTTIVPKGSMGLTIDYSDYKHPQPLSLQPETQRAEVLPGPLQVRSVG